MHVEELFLSNVRQFEGASYTFKPGFNLLIGENGAGKTTILSSLLIALGSKRQYEKRKGFYDEDIRFGARSLHAEVHVEFAPSEMRGFKYTKHVGKRSYWHGGGDDLMVLYYGSNESVTASFRSRRVPKVSKDGSRRQGTLEEFLYYGERNYSGDTDRERSFGSLPDVRKVTKEVLSKISPDLKDFYWRFEPYRCVILPSPNGIKEPIKGSKDLCSAVMRYLQENPDDLAGIYKEKIRLHPMGHLLGDFKSKAITPPFINILKSMGLTENLDELSTFACEVSLTPRIVIKSEKGDFLLNQLSDGQQRIFSLIVDIARMLSTNDEASIRETKGIVLIDEIDVHLHPRWQRIIVPALEDLFPRCQFIATTHSPFVIQSANSRKIQRLGVFDEESFADISRSIDDVVEDIQGIEMPQKSKREEELSRAAESYFKLFRQDGVDPKDLELAERKYRRASEPFTNNPAINALLRVEKSL